MRVPAVSPRRLPLTLGLLAVLCAPAPGTARPQPRPDLVGALRAALASALPFPAAGPDGTPAEGNAGPVWTVRWPSTDEAAVRVDVLANPLNAENRARALEVEAAIQKAAMQSQRNSQADYEQALRDFQRTGRVGDIREVSLRDDGLAGERYDAESQLSITAELVEGEYTRTVDTAVLPAIQPPPAGAAAVVRLAANVYRGEVTPEEPGDARFCAEQAWVFLGPMGAPVVARGDEQSATVSSSAPAGATGLVVWFSGNAELVERVMRNADWTRLRAIVEG